MKIRFFPLIIPSLLCFSLCLCQIACSDTLNVSDDEGETADNSSADSEEGDGSEESDTVRTVLVYMAAQNSLGKYNYHEADSAEIMAAKDQLSNEKQLLIFIDVDTAPVLYKVTAEADEPEVLYTWENDVCSTNPEVFQEVLEKMVEFCPSDEYGLVMWSHADGWLPATETDYDAFTETVSTASSLLAFGIDSGPNGNLGDSGAQMDIADMAAAIEAVGVKMKFIFFDACLMQGLEVAYELKDVTEFLVAAPIATPGAGSYYTHQIETGFFSSDPADIARQYMEDVQDPELTYDYSDFGLVISCIRTDRLEALAEAFKAALPNSVLAEKNSPDMTDVLNYQAYTSTYYYRPHNYDALQSIRLIFAEEDVEAVEQALNDILTYYAATETFYIGPGYWDMQTVPVDEDAFRSVSMFVPQTIYSTYAVRCKYGNLNTAFQNTAWYKAAGWEATGW